MANQKLLADPIAKIKDNNFDLGPDDVAFVFRSDGTREVYIPKINDEDEITPAMWTSAVLLFILEDEQLFKRLSDRFAAEHLEEV